MPKRKATSQGRRTLPGRSGGRGWFGPNPPTPQPERGRTMTRAPSRTRSLTRSLSRASSVAARAAANFVPYGNVALGAYDVARELFRGNNKRQNKGASTSKSKGFFGPTKDHKGVMDAHAKYGVVSKFEYGSVKTDAVNQVAYLAQSTCPMDIIIANALAAMLKKLLAQDNITIKNWDDTFVSPQNYTSQIYLNYKVRDGAAIQTFTYSFNNLTTFKNMVDAFSVHVQGLIGNNSVDQYLSIKLVDTFTGIPTGILVRAVMDLTGSKVEFDIKSTLKIQNRTVNSDGNNEADDVDNVPIYGKYFDYKTNGTVFQDYSTATGASAIVTHPVYGVLSTAAPTTTGTKMYTEIPLQTQLAGCKKSGKSHLDPGEIKTSVLRDKFTISFAKLIKIYQGKVSSVAGPNYTQYWLGKSRLFAWEKMINAVAMSATTQFNLAYEHQIDIGSTFYYTKQLITAPRTEQSTASLV